MFRKFGFFSLAWLWYQECNTKIESAMEGPGDHVKLLKMFVADLLNLLQSTSSLLLTFSDLDLYWFDRRVGSSLGWSR